MGGIEKKTEGESEGGRGYIEFREILSTATSRQIRRNKTNKKRHKQTTQ